MESIKKIPNFTSLKDIKAITGFGASSCWWSQAVDTEQKAKAMAKILYSDDGLKMNIYRYNVGAGYDKNNVRVPNPWRKTESFYNADGTFDFTRDKNAVRVMKECLKTGNVDTLIFFANSPHYSLTVTGQASGGLTEHFSNMPKENYNTFAKYFIDIAEHFIKEGYPVKYISPINEPQWKWGGDIVWQEGCHYEPQEVADCFHAFAKELEKRNSSLMLYGPESGEQGGLTNDYFDLINQDELIKKHLGVFAYHSYHDDDNEDKKDIQGKALDKKCDFAPISMSEWCELPCKHPTNDIGGCLVTARVIGQDLILGRSDSWTAWVAVNQWDESTKDSDCFSDGLLTAKTDFSDYFISERYYALAHFSRFLPIGSVSLEDVKSAKGKCPCFLFRLPNGKYALIAENESENDVTISLSNDIKDIEITITNSNNHLVKQDEGAKQSVIESGNIIIEKNSVITAIIDIK